MKKTINTIARIGSQKVGLFKTVIMCLTLLFTHVSEGKQNPQPKLVEKILTQHYKYYAEQALEKMFARPDESWSLSLSTKLDPGADLPILTDSDFGFPGTGILRSEAEAISNRIGEFTTAAQTVSAVLVLPANVSDEIRSAAIASVTTSIGIDASQIKISTFEGYSKPTISSQILYLLGALVGIALLGLWYYFHRKSALAQIERENARADAAEARKKEPEPVDPNLVIIEHKKSIEGILTTGQLSPQIASDSLTRICASSPSIRLAVENLLNDTDLDQILKAFPKVDGNVWKSLQASKDEEGFESSSSEMSLEEKIQSYKVLQKTLMLEMLSNMGADESEGHLPAFADINIEQITGLLESQSSSDAAALLVGLPLKKVQEACKDLDPAKLTEILSKLARLKEIPKAKLKGIEDNVVKMLSLGRSMGNVKVKSEALIPPLLSQLPAHQEQQVASTILRTNPEFLEAWSASRLYLDHLHFVNTESLVEIFSEMELYRQAGAWHAMGAQMQNKLQPMLSGKQWAALSEELENVKPGSPDTFTSLRLLLDALYSKYISNKPGAQYSLLDFNNSSETQNYAA
ncbi:hypothetical protein GW915_11645 [bacterium]|nr:hypothetical protein [bacterium]